MIYLLIVPKRIGLFFLFLLPFIIQAQAPVTFERYYDYGFAEAGNAVQQTSDGGYIIFGRQGIWFGQSKVLLIKIDSVGNEQWHKLIGNPYDNYAYCGQQTLDGGYILAGNTSLPGFSDQVYLIKTDANGDTTWTKNYGGTAQEFGWSVQQTLDGGYIIAGDTPNYPWLIKTDMNGDTLWTKNYSLNGYAGCVVYSLEQTIDSGYVLCGAAVNTSGTFNDALIIKTDGNGDTLWTKTIGWNSTGEIGQSIKQTSDTGYIVVGTTGMNDLQFLCIKTYNNGDTMWTKKWGGISGDGLYSAIQTSDGGYALFGATASFGVGGVDLILIKMDNNGDTLWTKLFGDASNQYSGYDRSLKQTSDGGYVLVGCTDMGFASAYIVKTDSVGFAITGVLTLSFSKDELNVYPNPFNTSATLVVPQEYSCMSELSFAFYDLLGRELVRYQIENENKISIQRGTLADGVYVIRLFSKNQIISSVRIIVN